MPSRRDILLIAAGAWAGVMRGARAQSDDPATRAADFIRQSGNDLAGLSAAATSSPVARDKLRAFLDRVADVDGVARFCLGRFWNSATPAQRDAYLAAFHEVLLNAVAIRLGDYPAGGQTRVLIDHPTRNGDFYNVATTVERPGNPAAHVTWVVAIEGAGPKIVDVVAEGMSLRLTQRSDYASYLSRNGGDVDTLIRAMRAQAEAGRH
jgi:phospholipid transport system substrate-binding protein